MEKQQPENKQAQPAFAMPEDDPNYDPMTDPNLQIFRPEDRAELAMWRKYRWRNHQPDPEQELEFQMTESNREAEEEFNKFYDRMKECPHLAVQAFTRLEPHLDNWRQRMQLLDTPGFETEMLPMNWSVGGSDHEIAGVPPRIMLRRAMYFITSGLTAQTMSLGSGGYGETDKLKNLYLAMATARWADEVLNGTRHSKKSGPQNPNAAPKGRGGARPGAGRPRNNNAPSTRITTEDEDEDGD